MEQPFLVEIVIHTRPPDGNCLENSRFRDYTVKTDRKEKNMTGYAQIKVNTRTEKEKNPEKGTGEDVLKSSCLWGESSQRDVAVIIDRSEDVTFE